MAGQQQQDKMIDFKTIILFKDQNLGIGSYGAVCKAKCDDLLCAAKIIHPTLFDPTELHQIAPHREHRLPIRRFQLECEFLSTVRHPNIVQYLGTHQDPDTRLPVLLMELMDDSLTHFLESSTQLIPYHIQVNFCHDITLALSFLHSNGIVHRDLSSNNVLLIGNVRAKVTDFGMARLGNQNPRATQLTFTMCPGTDVYMPPEAVKDNPVYTEKIDCFSFGVIVVQIVTQQFPKPGDRRKEIQFNQPGLPPIVEVPVSELERRQNHIDEMDPNHPLKQIALNCLKDRDVERPSAQQLCERVIALKEDPQYSESLRVVEARHTAEQDRSVERDREIRSLRQQHSQQVHHLQQIIQSQTNQLAEKDQTIARNEQTIAQNSQILREKDETIARNNETTTQKDETIAELREKIRQREKEKRVIIEEKKREIRQILGENNQLRSLRQHYNSQQVQDLQQIIQSQTSCLAEKDQTIAMKEQAIAQNNQTLREKDETIAELRQRNRQFEKEKGVVVEGKQRELRQKMDENNRLEKQLAQIKQQLEESEQIIVQLQKRIAELEQLSLRRATESNIISSSSKVRRDTVKLTWWRGKEAPCEMRNSCSAAVDGSILYVHHATSHQMLMYTISTSSWSQLPYSPTKFCSTVIIKNVLTLVGGYDYSGAFSNQLFSLTGEGSGRRWTEEFPPMPTKRALSTALYTGAALIVAGGRVFSGFTQTVEVLNSYKQWSTAAFLPELLSYAPSAVCGDQIYIMGRATYTCSIQTLLMSAGNNGARVWKAVAAPPVTLTACVSIRGRLLAIGGRDPYNKPTTDVHMYNPTTNSWEVISHMETPRYDCIAAVLPRNQLMVVGGYISAYGTTDSVEFASVE